ncbi:SEC14-like protein 1 [Sipha flava]|uniref:SEC14-like protein 1 n=2 Tax=Sipha flava TaxID=143950 RepID=A0A8B8FIC9_9HEMI|nr:SEC14-like protein 1 [Sipha flava]XP_025410473.1 SEC14-like protein 1 [Sipha flava]
MVQEYQSPVRVYKYPFEIVMAAYERRFPTSPLIPVFVGSEITADSTSADGSVRTTERRCKLVVEAPYLLKKIIGVDYIYFIQKNILDLRERCLNIEATNETFSTRVNVLEKCRYYVHPENSEWTCYEQSALLDIKYFLGFESTMEKLGMKQYIQNISKGKEIIEFYVDELKKEGVTNLPRWIPHGNDQNCDLNKTEESQNNPSSSPITDSQSKIWLEDEYIKRYIGELTPLQESKLVQFKKQLSQLQKSKLPSDTTLLRFLRATDFNIEKARENLSQSLTWRKKHNIDNILSEHEFPEAIKKYFPCGWHHHDKEGRPLYILRLGQMDVKGLLKSVGEHCLLKQAMHVCEEGLKLTKEATHTSGKPITTWCLLVDLEGLNMRHLWRPGVSALLRIIEIVESNYPETLGRVLIIRAPRVFPVLWTLVSTFINETTRTKFLFYGGNDYQASGGLSEFIAANDMPDFLGGPSKVKIPEGGFVPKNLYLKEGDLEKEAYTITEDSIYQSVTLTKGQAHEEFIDVEESGSVITWDFDVMRQDINFNVLRLLIEVQPSTLLNCARGNLNVIEKGWKEGEHYEKVEQTILCHDGESVQGSHLTTKRGTYILQWYWSSDSLNISSGHHTKAKIMYYYEMLKSADYRGSMSSLMSANSKFSCNR